MFLTVWDKARLKLELAEGKLRQLYSQLKIQDKEELTLKKLKAEGGDKVLKPFKVFWTWRVPSPERGSHYY